MKKRLMVVRADCSHTKTMEEREAYLQSVKTQITGKLTEMNMADQFSVMVVPDTIQIEVVEK